MILNNLKKTHTRAYLNEDVKYLETKKKIEREREK
jgi:hypothetical protein